MNRAQLIRCCLAALAMGILAGCRLPGMNARGFSAAWDNFRCDRRVAVFVNLSLDTSVSGGCSSPNGTSPADYNRALAYFHARGVSEVVFCGRTTHHGSIGEFRALNGGFATIPDPAYKSGHATVTWLVRRTYRFAPDDTKGKYHPSTFWPRIFNTPWSDSYVGHNPLPQSSSPVFLICNHYGARCRVQEVAYGIREGDKDGKRNTGKSWEVVREWDVEPSAEEDSWMRSLQNSVDAASRRVRKRMKSLQI